MKKIFLAIVVVLLLTACEKQPKQKETPTNTISLQPTDEDEAKTPDTFIYEAEDAVHMGKVKTASSKKGYSGSGYVTGFEGDEDACRFTIELEKEGFYDLNFVSASMGGQKENLVYLDEVNIGTIMVESEQFTDSILTRVYLTAGSHEIEVRKSWGWIALDSLVLKSSEALDSSLYEVSAELINPNADENTKQLMQFLADNYGKNFLSGQYCDGGIFGMEFQSIWRVTGGKRPAVLGLDFIEYSPSRAANGSTSKATEYAIEFHNMGGIVTFCWHWNPPERYLTDIWWKGFYTESTDINLKKIMDGEDAEGYDLLLRDIDAIAEQLSALQEAGVPVLWRPLHEASGGWFWWGASGSEAFKELWKLLYDRLTNVHGLNNLIWIWNGQNGDWYPGDDYVDIIGEDIYPGERVYTSQMGRYLQAAAYTDAKKMIVLSENGCLFDPDLALRDGAMWGFFATWGGEFVLKNSGLNAYSEQYTEEEMLKKVYHHPNVLTLEDLPGWNE